MRAGGQRRSGAVGVVAALACAVVTTRGARALAQTGPRGQPPETPAEMARLGTPVTPGTTVLAPVVIERRRVTPTRPSITAWLEVFSAEPATVRAAIDHGRRVLTTVQTCSTPCRAWVPAGHYHLVARWRDGRDTVVRFALDPPGLRVVLRAPSIWAGGVALMLLGVGGMAGGVALGVFIASNCTGWGCGFVAGGLGTLAFLVAGGAFLAPGIIVTARGASGGIEERIPLIYPAHTRSARLRLVATPALVGGSGAGVGMFGAF